MQRDLPELDHRHVSQVKAIGDEEEQVLYTPHSFRGSDLGQGPSNPSLDGIPKQQGYTHNCSEDLIED